MDRCKGLFPPKAKAQSAMEYLMTYGWAVLVIAVVLSVLFEMGVFNSANFAPKASPGACQVMRPDGPGTTMDISTQGVCNNELPQYVTSFGSSTSCVDAQYVPIGVSSLGQSSMSSLTISYWEYMITPQVVLHLDSANPTPSGSGIICNNNACSVPGPLQAEGPGQSFVDTWQFVTLVLNASMATMYVNGNPGPNVLWYGPLTGISDLDFLGYEPTCSDWSRGSIADVQIYNMSLDAASVQALYQEGIGGVPITPQNLVGWWPLNGNANDYSGNLNSGQATGIVYTDSWTTSYNMH
jgi:hypothetical protein